MDEFNGFYGLAFGCPFEFRTGKCPFSKMDHLEVLEKVEWIDQLTSKVKDEIFLHHCNCFSNRELMLKNSYSLNK